MNLGLNITGRHSSPITDQEQDPPLPAFLEGLHWTTSKQLEVTRVRSLCLGSVLTDRSTSGSPVGVPGGLGSGLISLASNPVPGELPACWVLPPNHTHLNLIQRELPDQPARDQTGVFWLSVGV